MFDKKRCGDRLKRLREAKNKTQQVAARESGVSSDTIRKLEQGRRAPSVEIVSILAKYYETTTDYIILGTTFPECRYNMKLCSLSKEQRKKLAKMLDEIKRIMS